MNRFSLVVFLLTLAACSKEITTPSHSTKDTDPVSVTLRIDAEDMTEITRATSETGIGDVNLYLFNTANGGVVHVYSTSAICNFECPAGRYALYVIANLHRDPGVLPLAQVKALKAPYNDAYADLPMTGTAQIEIPASRNGAAVKLPPVVVRRNVAKIAYNITVDPVASNIKLHSVRICSVPSNYSLFDGSATAYDNGTITCIPATSAASYSRIIYVPENLRGTVSSITTEREKDAQHAPKNATYLLIRATRGSSVLDYRVYLGENNTTDFNVRRNSRQTLDIVIKGVKQVDTRYNSYIVNVNDDMDNLALDKYCIPRATLPWTITVKIDRTRDDGLQFRGAFQLLEGSAQNLTINNTRGGFYGFTPLIGTTKLDAKYAPDVITQAAPYLKYRVSVADEYGFSQDIDIERLCVNNISVQYANGTITAAGAVFMTEYGPLFRALCYEKGCTLTAKPATGYVFDGWYADEHLTQRISTSPTYKHVPKTTYDRLYANFEKERGNVTIYTDPQIVGFTSDKGATFDGDLEAYIVPYGSTCTFTANYRTPLFKGWYDEVGGSGNLLSTATTYSFTATDNRTVAPGFIPATDLSAAGRANCYIARAHNAGYIFNARTQGNGKTTTGLTPQTLNGTTARVLWETGGTRGAVIAAVEHNGGVISLRTGTSYGNALIGLFNASNVCIWSWHIWAVDYDPTATAQTYMGGRVFMDRNLGALTTSTSDVSARGLYYQWGRPVPFIYPQTLTATTRATQIAATGYSYGSYDPLQGCVMTVANALAHPWIYMLGYYPGSDRDEDYSDWLRPRNPNLWGNASSSAYSDTSAKSIYDPCPAGWRVPDRRAFTNAGLTKTSTTTSQCYNLRYSASTATTPYPMSGYFDGMHFVGNGTTAYVWTNAPAQQNNVCLGSSTALGVTSAAVTPEARIQRDYALPVRCVKE